MKKINAGSILDQQKFSTHALLFLISLAALIISLLVYPQVNNAEQIAGFIIMVFIQVEVFVFLARLIFHDLRTASTRREITRNILTKFALFMFVCFIAALIIILGYICIATLIKGNSFSGIFSHFFHYDFAGWFKSTIIGLSFGAVIFIIIQWQDALKREQKLREENLVFQNETLKTQINPHFLFNSLNTVSSLVQSNPGMAEKFINNLSSVYRYILENVHKDTVPLQSEIDFVTEYFELYKIRDERKIALNVNVDDAGSCKIYPVSLQILIENAIKHNIATRENPLNISIYIEDQQIVVKNNLQKMSTLIPSTGIGLKNLTERVRLATGKSLIVEETDNYFIVKIPLL
jgi:two-component system, LytTR family, sensor kinase